MTPEVNRIYTGDCLSVMAGWPENFVDTVITDPPYGLDFMGKDWDHGVPGPHFWAEALRVAKPGASLAAFGGTRTFHRLAVAIEDAGWQIRDCLMWLYGSGFPKSLDISKAIDKAKGVERKVVGKYESFRPNAEAHENGKYAGELHTNGNITAPATDLARQWSGYGTALKPAWEPIILAMKPLDGTFAENAEKWEVAGLNVDGGRIGNNPGYSYPNGAGGNSFSVGKGIDNSRTDPVESTKGRWPANLILDEEAAGMLDGNVGYVHGAGNKSLRNPGEGNPETGGIYGSEGGAPTTLYDHGGNVSRFFYVAKSCRAERNEGCEGMENRAVHRYGAGIGEGHTPDAPVVEKNHHPTVKPLELMKYLCMLTKTPTGGIVLDPFAGSGTTLWAAEFHNRPWLGIEMNPEYVAIANARIARERSQMKMAI